MCKPFLPILICLGTLATAFAAVKLQIDGLKASISNDYVEINFKEDATLLNIKVQGTDLSPHKNEKSFYFDWSAGRQVPFRPVSIHVREQNSSIVHFYWLGEKSAEFSDSELHYIMKEDVPGIYTYVKFTNNWNYTVSFSLARTVYRFNPDVLTRGTNQERIGPVSIDGLNCVEVQDNTCRFPNGTYYTKYDYAVYLRKTNYHGLFGGGFGAFLIMPSREYFGGGPLRQSLTFHTRCLALNGYVSTHYGTPPTNQPPGWRQMYGPFLLYFPTGDVGTVLAAAKNQVAVEQSIWPYAFVKDDFYPLERGSVSGYVHGQKSATIALWDSLEEEFDRQQLGHLYSVETDSNGYFFFDKIRPGIYRICGYATAGFGIEGSDAYTVNVTANVTKIVNLTMPEPENIIWSLGEANRRSSEFKFSDQPRNYKWEWMVPATLNFTIGKSNPKEDWYYAQTQRGDWYLKYDDKRDGNPRILRIALAAASRKPHFMVFLNGHRLLNKYYPNDGAIYRSTMQSGSYYSEVLTVDPKKVVNGENVIRLFLSRGQIMYDVISLQRVV